MLQNELCTYFCKIHWLVVLPKLLERFRCTTCIAHFFRRVIRHHLLSGMFNNVLLQEFSYSFTYELLPSAYYASCILNFVSTNLWFSRNWLGLSSYRLLHSFIPFELFRVATLSSLPQYCSTERFLVYHSPLCLDESKTIYASWRMADAISFHHAVLVL